MSTPTGRNFEDPPIGAAVEPVSASSELLAAGYSVRRVPPEAIARWMGAGWRDFRQSIMGGLVVGLFCVAVGAGLIAAIWNSESAVLILPLLTGFMLVAPILAVPLYELSRRISLGERAGSSALVAGFRRNAWGIGFMCALLMMFLYAWLRVATMIWFLFFGLELPPLGAFLTTALADYFFVVSSFGIGGVLATLIFAISAISLPMLVDRPVDAMTAAMTSVRACMANPLTMGTWAALIAILTLIGIGTALVGLVLVIPVIGHASWHAYADLVGAARDDTQAPAS